MIIEGGFEIPTWVIGVFLIGCYFMYKLYQQHIISDNPSLRRFTIDPDALELFGPIGEVEYAHYKILHDHIAHRNQAKKRNQQHFRIALIFGLIPIPVIETWRYEVHVIKAGHMETALELLAQAFADGTLQLLQVNRRPLSWWERHKTNMAEVSREEHLYHKGKLPKPPARAIFGILGPYTDRIAPRQPAVARRSPSQAVPQQPALQPHVTVIQQIYVFLINWGQEAPEEPIVQPRPRRLTGQSPIEASRQLPENSSASGHVFDLPNTDQLKVPAQPKRTLKTRQRK